MDLSARLKGGVVDVDVVFFDAGSTLIYPDPPVGEVYADALRRRGVPAGNEAVQNRFQAVWREARAERPVGSIEYGMTAGKARAWWRGIVRDSLEPFGTVDDFDAMFEELWEHFARADAWSIYEDVQPTLDRLEGMGKRLGLISNWDVRIEKMLSDLGLARRLEFRIVSYQVGVEKPDPTIFRSALNLCGRPPERALHIGDSYREDYLGALSAGMRAVWLCRDGDAADQHPGATAVAGLRELPELLD